MIVVSNASPLITLSKLGLFDLPRRLFNKIIIPQEVWPEPDWREPAPGRAPKT